MRMRRRDHIGPGLVNLRMDHEPSLVDGQLRPTFGDISLAVDKDQVRRFDVGEVFGEGVHPEMVFQDGV